MPDPIKRRIVLAVLALLFLLSSLPIAYGEGVKLEDIYSLADLLEIAIRNDSSIQLTELQIKEATAALKGLKAVFKPQFIFSGEHVVENVINHSLARQFISIEFEWNDEVFKIELLEPHEKIQTTIYSMTIAQQLGANAPLKTALQKATTMEEISFLQREQSLSQLALKVQQSYHMVLKAYYALEGAEELVAYALWNVETAQHKESKGTESLLHVLQEKNALLEAENHLSTAQTGLKLALLGLLHTIGLDHSYLPEAQPFVQQLLVNKKEIEPWTLDFDSAVNYALEHRPELLMAKNQLVISQLDYQDHQQTRDWTINLMGRYLLNDVILDGALDSNRLLRGTIATSDVIWPNDSVEDLLDPSPRDIDPWQVGIQASYTFGTNSRKKAEEERLILSCHRAQIQYQGAKDGIYLEVYSLYEQLEQAWRTYQTALAVERESLETYKNLEMMYHKGSITKKNLQEGQLYVTQARNQVFSTGLDYRVQKGELAKALGIDSTTLMEALVGIIHWSDLSLKGEE